MPEPLTHCLVLTEEQSAFVRECGKHFAVVTIGSYPDSVGRAVLHIVEFPQDLAADACAVALGQKRAVPIKPAKPRTRVLRVFARRCACAHRTDS